MYKVLLPDGQETVPVDLQTLAQWATEGRIHSETSIVEIESAYRFRAADHPYLRNRVVSAPVLVGTHFQPAELPDDPVNPWFSIWTKPRQTIRQIIATNPEQSIFLLATLQGLTGINAGDIRRLSEMWSVPVTLAVDLIVAPIIGIVTLFLSGFVVRLVAGWFGGQAEGSEVRAALAWSYVPYIWTLPLTVIGLILALATDTDLASFLIFVACLRLVVVFWQIGVSCHTLAEVEGFSSGKAFGVLFLAGLLMLVPLFMLVVLIGMVIGGIAAFGTMH